MKKSSHKMKKVPLLLQIVTPSTLWQYSYKNSDKNNNEGLSLTPYIILAYKKFSLTNENPDSSKPMQIVNWNICPIC